MRTSDSRDDTPTHRGKGVSNLAKIGKAEPGLRHPGTFRKKKKKKPGPWTTAQNKVAGTTMSYTFVNALLCVITTALLPPLVHRTAKDRCLPRGFV